MSKKKESHYNRCIWRIDNVVYKLCISWLPKFSAKIGWWLQEKKYKYFPQDAPSGSHHEKGPNFVYLNRRFQVFLTKAYDLWDTYIVFNIIGE